MPQYTAAGQTTLHDNRPYDKAKEAERLMATAEDRQRRGFVEIPEGCGVHVADYYKNRHNWTDDIDDSMVPELKRQLQKHCDDSKVGDILPHEIEAVRKVCDVMLLHHIGHGAYHMHVQARRIVPIIGKFLELTDSACRISLYQPTFMMVVADLAFAIGGAVLQGNEDLARWVEGRLHAHKVTGGTNGNMAMDEHRDHPYLVDRFVQAGGDGAKVSQMRWTITSDGSNLYFVASTATGNGTFVPSGISGIYAYYKMSSHGGAVTVLVPVLAGQGVVGANSTGHAVFNFHGVAPFKVGPAPACALLARGAYVYTALVWKGDEADATRRVSEVLAQRKEAFAAAGFDMYGDAAARVPDARALAARAPPLADDAVDALNAPAAPDSLAPATQLVDDAAPFCEAVAEPSPSALQDEGDENPSKRARVSPAPEPDTPPPPEFTLCREICEAVAAADAERDATEATDRLAARFAKDDGVDGVEAVDGAAEASSLGLRKLCGADRGVTAASFAEDRGHAAAELAYFQDHGEARAYTWARAEVGDVGDLELRAAVRRRDARRMYDECGGRTRYSVRYYVGVYGSVEAREAHHLETQRVLLVGALEGVDPAYASLRDAGVDAVAATAVAYLDRLLPSPELEPPATDPWSSLECVLERLNAPLSSEAPCVGGDIREVLLMRRARYALLFIAHEAHFLETERALLVGALEGADPAYASLRDACVDAVVDAVVAYLDRSLQSSVPAPSTDACASLNAAHLLDVPTGSGNPKKGFAALARDRLLASRDDAGNCAVHLLPRSSLYYAKPSPVATFGIQMMRGSDAHGANLVLSEVDNEVTQHRGLHVGDVVVGALGESFDATTDLRQVIHGIRTRLFLDLPIDLLVRPDAASVVAQADAPPPKPKKRRRGPEPVVTFDAATARAAAEAAGASAVTAADSWASLGDVLNRLDARLPSEAARSGYDIERVRLLRGARDAVRRIAPRQGPHMGPQNCSDVPPDYFSIKLYQMLQEQREILTWDPNGGIIIHDRQRLEATLSVYFRHNKFRSFQRQLTNFGFHKKRKAEAGLIGTAAQQRNMAAYGHPLLVGQQPEAVRDPVSVEASRRYREGDNLVRKTGTLTGQQRRSSAYAPLSDALPVGSRRDYSITINAARSSCVEDGP